jgi:hypothetical protein
VINPIPIFNRTLILFKEVTLNNGVLDMVLIKFNNNLFRIGKLLNKFLTTPFFVIEI